MGRTSAVLHEQVQCWILSNDWLIWFQVEAVYLFTEGDASVEAQELLRRKVKALPKLLYNVA